MKRVYRILREPYANQPFDGEGARRFGGRWSRPGTRLAYTSEHLSLAMIEYFVHIDPGDPPRDLVVATAEIPDTVTRIFLSASRLPADWRRTPPSPRLADIGDTFVMECRACVLVAPSALAPSESNWLVNPAHADFRKIRVRPPARFQYDPRFFD